MNKAVETGIPGVLEESVCFSHPTLNGKITLRGILATPKQFATGKTAAVILIHGWGGNRIGPHRILVRITRKLAAKGILALRFDLSGRGESDGTAAKTSLDDMIVDTITAHRFLRNNYECPTVGYCGICSGGNVAIGASTMTHAARIALISTLPFTPRSGRGALRKTASLLKQYIKKACKPQTWARLIRGEINTGAVAKTLKQSGMESSGDRKLKDSIRDIMGEFATQNTPSLFVYGGSDPEAAPAWEHYRDFCEKNGIPVQCKFINEANHNFYSRIWSEIVEQTVVDFMTEE